MNAPPEERRRELDRLQAQIATRASITHLARGAVSTIFALMIYGMAGLFEWGKDNVFNAAPYALPVAVAASALMIFALSRFWLGYRAHLREVVLFAELQSLRRELKLEDPSMLLPP
ncbi:MAG TPA: hypothetical protein VIG99_32795 [Myxococcaceae bacterium]